MNVALRKQSLLGQTWGAIKRDGGKIDLDFEKFLLSRGKESWLPNWKKLSSGIGRNSYSNSTKMEMFREWDYESVDMMLQEVGLWSISVNANTSGDGNGNTNSRGDSGKK